MAGNTPALAPFAIHNLALATFATCTPALTTFATPNPASAQSATNIPALDPSATHNPALAPPATNIPALAPSATHNPALAPSATNIPALASSVTYNPALAPSATNIPTLAPFATHMLKRPLTSYQVTLPLGSRPQHRSTALLECRYKSPLRIITLRTPHLSKPVHPQRVARCRLLIFIPLAPRHPAPIQMCPAHKFSRHPVSPQPSIMNPSFNSSPPEVLITNKSRRRHHPRYLSHPETPGLLRT